MICQLCGFEFDEKGMTCHSSCAFNKYCAVICCPNCGFQTADESRSRLAMAAKRLLQRRPTPTTANPPPSDTICCALSLLQPGQTGKVVKINAANAARLERLQLFGLTPGAHVTVEQRSPEFILRVDYTTLTVEAMIAADIVVELNAVY
jgi:Fe2+ transport system protein FeoA